MIFDNTEFKPIYGWNGYYIDRNGRVLSFMIIGSHIRREDFSRPRILKTQTNSAGYPTVSVNVNGKRKALLIHHAVAEAFIGHRPNGTVIDHIDGNRSNCDAKNLRYISQGENMMRSEVRKRYLNGRPYEVHIVYNGKEFRFSSWNKTVNELKLKKFSINTLKYLSNYGENLPVENKDYRLTKYNQSQETIEIELYSSRE